MNENPAPVIVGAGSDGLGALCAQLVADLHQ